jgi:hypothetical protein
MSAVQEVSRNQSVSVAGRRGMTIRIARGRVWLTRDGDIRDYVLNAGDSMRLDASGRVVLFGLTDGFLQIDTPARAPGVWSGLLARFTWMGERA